MIARVRNIVFWLGVGHLAIGVLLWILWTVLQMYRLRVWANAATGALAVCAVVVGAIVESAAIVSWQRLDDVPDRAVTPRRWAVQELRYTRAVGWFLVAVLLFAGLWWLGGRIDASWVRYRGQVDSFVMNGRSATAQVADNLISAALWFVRYPVGLALAVGVLGAAVQDPPRALRLQTIRQALHWRPLLGITIAVLLFIVWPWRFVNRPYGALPSNGFALMFVGLKDFAIYVLMTTGWAVVLSAGARQSRAWQEGPPRDQQSRGAANVSDKL